MELKINDELILKRNKENSNKFSLVLNSNSFPPAYWGLQASITPKVTNHAKIYTSLPICFESSVDCPNGLLDGGGP